MTLLDYILFPVYVALIWVVIRVFVLNKIDPELRSLFKKGLWIKIASSFATGLIYWYYYGDGDTIYYFARINLIHKAFGYESAIGYKLLFNNPKIYDPTTYDWFVGLKARDASGFLLVKIGFLFSLFSFKAYSVIALFFSLFSYSGVWRLFLLFNRKFPDIPKTYLAFTTLYLPSVFFWGSGLFKDTLTLGFLCWAVVIIDDFVARRKFSVFKLLLLGVSIYAIGIIKSYILLAMIPALMFWAYKAAKLRIRSKWVSALSTPVLLIVISLSGILILQQLSSVFTKFALDNIQDRAEDMQRWHTVRGEQKGESSSYDLGHVEFTPIGILRKIPAAINVAVFRPYIWEAHNPVMLLAALESQIFLLLFVRLGLFRLRRLYQLINRNSFLSFSLIFTLIFAFSVGFTSYNFGALVRYKVPFLPFLTLILVVAYHDFRQSKRLRSSKVVQEVP